MTVAAAVASTPIVVAAHAILRGQVQGLGVRPAIANLANQHQLKGSVGNMTGGVAILIEGPSQNILRFQQELPFAIPREAVVEKCEWSEAASRDLQSFTIVQQAAYEKLETPVPSDRATCGDCLRETTEQPSRRRAMHSQAARNAAPGSASLRRCPMNGRRRRCTSFPSVRSVLRNTLFQAIAGITPRPTPARTAVRSSGVAIVADVWPKISRTFSHEPLRRFGAGESWGSAESEATNSSVTPRIARLFDVSDTRNGVRTAVRSDDFRVECL
jgi:acylphosphatase